MTQYGATHRLIVEHEDDGIEDVALTEGGTREAHVCRVLYYVEHPEDCLTPSERRKLIEQEAKRGTWASINSETEAVNPHEARYGCPIDDQIEAVGLMDALAITRWGRGGTQWNHIQEGTYNLNFWATHYSSPEGDDWDAGLEYERVDGKTAGHVVMEHPAPTTLSLEAQ